MKCQTRLEASVIWQERYLRRLFRQSLGPEVRFPHLENGMEQEQSKRVHFHLGLRQKLLRELTKCDLPAHSEHTNNVPVLLKPPNEAPADGTRVSLWENGPKVRDAGMNFQL